MERRRYAILAAALFGAYVAAAKLGINLEVGRGVITPVWAPTGIALAALTLHGRRLWPAVALGAFAANATSGASLAEAGFITVGNTLQAVVGTTLVLQAGFHPALQRVRDVFVLLAFGVIVSPVISATNGATTLVVSGGIDRADYGSSWILWWIGDAMGVLIVAPLIFILSTRPWQGLSRHRLLEGLLLVGAISAVGSIVFLGGLWRYPLLLFPLLIWATLRFQQLGSTTGSFLAVAFAVAGAVRGTTPLGRETTEVIEIVEGLTAGVAVSLLILGAALAERGRAGEALARAHASLAEAQELAHLGSWEWDVRADRVSWSEELYRLWNIERDGEPMTYEWYLGSVHPDDRELVRAMVDRAVTTGAPFSFEHRILRSDGSSRWIHSRGRVVADETDAPMRMLGTAQDITDRKLIDELRDSILATVSHELRTPLTAIIGFSVTLKERGARLAEETRQEVVANLAEQARKLDRLLSDLLDIDRLRHGFVLPSFRETDIAGLVEHVASGFATPTHAIEVRAEPAVANVDPPKIERIVDNLLANAVNHTPPGTKIHVNVEPGDTGVLITVEDDGPGVAEADREAIFGIFTRGKGGSFARGTGIGLSLVAQFTELHGGRAWVEETSGGGASFRVLLPRTPPR